MAEMSENRIETLLRKYRSQELSAKELQELIEYIRQRPSLKFALLNLDDTSYDGEDLENMDHAATEKTVKSAWQKIEARAASRVKWRQYTGLAAAAAIAAIVIFSHLLLPGSDNSKLTNGPKINTLITQRKIFRIPLPDGTIAWLNNASSLHFPTIFTGPHREVKIDSGEVYFEVAKHPEQPFIVQVGKGDAALNVQVLGTSFNISAYADEPCIRTTVVDGKVQVSIKDHSEFLTENEQLTIGPNNIWQRKKTVNAAAVIAWRNGILRFDGDSLTQVLRTLARWYNRELRITDTLGQRVFKGELSRSITVEQALDYISGHGTTFKYSLTGNKIIISL